MYLPEGCGRPDPAELDAFWEAACRERPDLRAGPAYQVRWIGLDQDSTEQIFELIARGDKTGTFTLPWIVERTDQPAPEAGDPVVLVDFAGRPRMLIRLTRVQEVRFGSITEADTAVDGTPVRSLDVWKPLHVRYWTPMLAPFGLEVDDEMPVWVEAFEVLD